jgi:hypothetical protein
MATSAGDENPASTGYASIVESPDHGDRDINLHGQPEPIRPILWSFV